MKQAPKLKFASDNSTSADFLVSRVIQAYQNLDPSQLDEIATLYTLMFISKIRLTVFKVRQQF